MTRPLGGEEHQHDQRGDDRRAAPDRSRLGCDGNGQMTGPAVAIEIADIG